jgi:uncharacterized protein (DUF952 family)
VKQRSLDAHAVDSDGHVIRMVMQQPHPHKHDLIYKICDSTAWCAAERAGTFVGAGADLADGYIHFSTRDQVAETAAKHFAGEPNLLLIAVAADALGPALKWEPSRGGALFPHLYAPLPLTAVRFVEPLALGPDRNSILSDLSEYDFPPGG